MHLTVTRGVLKHNIPDKLTVIRANLTVTRGVLKQCKFAVNHIACPYLTVTRGVLKLVQKMATVIFSWI